MVGENSVPYLTSGIGGTGGVIKQRPEDFRVDEVPLYEAGGQGDHVYFRVRKAGVPTPEAVQRIARYMGRSPGDFGVAGMKDAQAVTTQYMSLEHADADRLAAYRDQQVEVAWVGRHGNKLRTGHLAGNRFTIKVRDCREHALEAARDVLSVLERRGVPNFFGAQRFGARGDTAKLGEALFRGDGKLFVELFLGRPIAGDPPDCRKAREAFDAGDLDTALRAWPYKYRDQRAGAKAWERRKNPADVIRTVDKRFKRLYVSAFQSVLFNEVLARRLDSIDTVYAGDLAMKAGSGGVFLVEQPEVERPRAAAFEISPTGPIVGRRCRFAQGNPGQIEKDILASHGLAETDFANVETVKMPGERRPLRFQLKDISVLEGSDEHGSFLEVAFFAPSGCYATVVLNEVMKQAVP